MTFPTGWTRKCALTIDSSQVVGSGTHTGFPVLLTQANLPSDMLDKDGSAPASMGGGEIRFTSDSAGSTKLPCNVVEFITADNPANATAIIYVGLDLPTASDTTIYVWYNTAAEVDQPKYNANTDADGFQGSDYVWTNYDIVLPLGGFGGLRNLKQANASKNVGRYGDFAARPYTVATRASGNKYISFPSMVKVGARLYCCAREAPEHIVNVSGGVTVRYSDDMGRTWAEDSGLVLTDGSYDLRDPQLFAQSDGTLWVFYSKTNAGDTSRVVTYRKASAPYTSWGSETALTSMTKANNGSKPIELASGRIMVPCYDVDGSANTWPFVRWTDNDGSTWTTDYLTADGAAPGTYDAYNETSIAEDPTTPGNLVAIFRRNGYLTLYRCTSTDSGETWSSPASVAALAIDSGSLPDMPELLYCKDGDLLLAYAKDRNAPEFRVVRSADNGATWETPYSVIWANEFVTTSKPGGATTGSGGYCSVVEMAKGLFAVAYYFDNSSTGVASVWCTHFSKVEDGDLNYWTDTTFPAAGQVGGGMEMDDTRLSTGNASLSYWNNVHNGGAFTISGWAKFNQVSDEAHCFIGSAAVSTDRGFFFAYENRTAMGAPDALRLYKADGSGTDIDNQSSAITGGTAARRYGVFCDAGGTPTFIANTTTYAGANAITGTAGDAERPTRIGGASYTGGGGDDLTTLRLDGWMNLWSLSPLNLGADYEKTRYNAEAAPDTFVMAGSPVALGATGAEVRMRRSGSIGGASIGSLPIGGGSVQEIITTLSGAATLDTFTTTGGTSSAAPTLSGAATLDDFTTTGGTSASVGTITLVMVENWARASLANTLIENVAIIDVSARTVTLELTNQTVGSDGNLSIVNAAIVAGTPYMAATWNTDGTVRGFARVVAT